MHMENIIRYLAVVEWCAFKAHSRIFFTKFCIFLDFSHSIVFLVQLFLNCRVEGLGIDIVTIWAKQEVGFRIVIHFLEESFCIRIVVEHYHLTYVFRLFGSHWFLLCHWFDIETVSILTDKHGWLKLCPLFEEVQLCHGFRGCRKSPERQHVFMINFYDFKII